MAEPTTPPTARAAQRDVLLATKLHVPHPRPGFLPRPRLLEQLAAGTARELTEEVLARQPSGRSNRAIAEELVVTLDTVKSHVTHILDKLGAANRTQAVTRARQLGLLRRRRPTVASSGPAHRPNRPSLRGGHGLGHDRAVLRYTGGGTS